MSQFAYLQNKDKILLSRNCQSGDWLIVSVKYLEPIKKMPPFPSEWINGTAES